MKTALALVLAWSVAAGAIAPGADDLALQVTTATTAVKLGEGFPLTVTRRWRRDLLPRPWPADALAPLAFAVETRSRRDDGDFVEETWHCRAHAFALGALTVTPRPLHALAADGRDVTAVAAPLRIEVRPRLAADADPAIELPSEPRAVPSPAGAWVVLALASMALLALVVATFRRRPRLPPPPSPREPSQVRARRRLAALPVPATATELRADAIALAAIVRDDLIERFAVPATARTTTEIEAHGALQAQAESAARTRLLALLAYCDHVKFGRMLPSLAQRAAAVADAEAWLEPQGLR